MYCLIKLISEIQHVYGKQAMGNPQAKVLKCTGSALCCKRKQSLSPHLCCIRGELEKKKAMTNYDNSVMSVSFVSFPLAFCVYICINVQFQNCIVCFLGGCFCSLIRMLT